MITVSHNWLLKSTTISMEPEDLQALTADDKARVMAAVTWVRNQAKRVKADAVRILGRLG